MSQATEKRHIKGLGEVYWNNVRLGSLMDEIKMSPALETVFRKEGNSTGKSIGRLVSDDLTVECTIGDFKMEQWRYAIGVAPSLASGSAVQSASTSAVLRKSEEVQLIGTTAKTLSEANISNVIVSSLDFETQHEVTTDYSIISATATITRVSGAGIVSGDYVNVTYDFTDSAAAIYNFGGKEQLFEAVLVVKCLTDNGKIWQLRCHRAVRDSGFDYSLMENDFSKVTLKFQILHDLTKVKGQQLGYWALEA